MAIPAIDSIIPSVVFVAELDGLIANDILIGKVRSARAAEYHRQSQGRQDHSRE
jgi:hypothetical protein